jgi:hypothetical protein
MHNNCSVSLRGRGAALANKRESPVARPRTNTMHNTFSIFYLDQNGATQ